MAKIYVACLASYNNGVLHGEWIDLEHESVDGVQEQIDEILRSSPYPNVRVECPECEGVGRRFVGDPDNECACLTCGGTGTVPSAEEWAVHDSEGLPSSFGEYPNLDDMIEFQEGYEAHGEPYLAWVEYGHTLDADDFQQCYRGQYTNWTEYAEELISESGVLSDMPEIVQRYFDYDSYGRDLQHDGMWSAEAPGGIYVFGEL